jgi:predicted phosphodiesterase
MIFSLLLLFLSFFIITSFPIISFAQQSDVQVPTIAQIPSVEEQSQSGFLIITTNVINNNEGTKEESDFTINLLGSQSFPSSFQASPLPKVQIISIQEGPYSISVDNTQGYKISFGNQCQGQIKAGDKKSCSITLDDDSTTKKTTPEQLPIFPLSLPSLPNPAQTSGGEERLTISQIPSVEEEQSQLGFLILATHVINDNGGMKQAPNFKINILGSQSFPSSFQAASSNLMQIISIKEGQYSISVDNTQGYKISFGNQCQGQIKTDQIKTCLITLDDLTSTTPPPVQDPVAKLVAPLQVQGGQTVVLDGSQSVADTLTITQTAGQPVTLTDIGSFKKQFTAPNGNFQLGFQAIAQKGNKQTITQVSIQVSTNLPPPTGDSFVPFNFAAAGDWGCNSNTDKNVQSILSKESELVLGLGDYSYESDADCWLESISPINDRMKISIGNHDSDEEEGPEITVQFLDHFNLDKQYYSFTKGNVFFLVMSTQVSYSENSEQFNFVKQELEKASNDPNIDWVVVYYHKPMYASSTKHAGLTSLRDIYHPLFDQYKVDLVLAGHNHNYQRSFPLQFNEADSDKPILVNKNQNTYNEIGVPIFITSGTGGVSLHSLGAQAEFNAKQFGKFGHLNVNVSKDTSNKLVGTFYDLTGNKLDEFTITKALTSPLPSPSSSATTIKATSQIDNSIVDKFGVKQIYPTKPGGEEWFMNMDNMKADPRFEMKGSIQDLKKNPDGSWSPNPGDKVRLVAYTSDSKGKFDENNMPTYNLKELAAKGHWYKDNDWKNIEMGGYFKLNNATDLGMGYSFSTRSIADTNTNGGCGGATPKFNFGFDGEIKAKKEMWHVSLIDSPGVNDEDLSPSIIGKWLGIKGIIYNLPGDKGVKQEFWIDKTNDGQWEKVYEFTDQGGFGERGNNGPEKCGGTWDQLYTWGSPKSVFRWDQSDVSFKFLSVREILPPPIQ